MDRKKYSLKDASLAFIFSIIAVLCASFFMTALVSFVSSSNNFSIEDVLNFDYISYINMFLSALIFFIVFFFQNFFSKKDYFQASRLKTKFNYKICLAMIVLAAVVLFSSLNMTNLFNYVFSLISPMELDNSFVYTMDNFGQFIWLVLLLAFLPAVCEELVFRGIIYNGLREKFSAVKSILISSLLFAFIHLSIYKSFYQFILGLVLGFLVYYTGSIVYGMIFHFFNNFFIIFANYISPNKAIFEFSSFGVKEILLSILFFAIGIVLVILFFNLLKNYTNKHKKYLNLENSNLPLGNDNGCCESSVSGGEINSDKLSEYDKKYLKNSSILTDKGLLILGIVIIVFLWFVNSFGGL